MPSGCIECSTYLPNEVYYYSLDNFGAPLCRNHQNWLRNSEATQEAIDLYTALRKRGVPAHLEKFDGYKTIDIAIPDCKVNIEVDGMQHNFNPRQALADLQRTYYSFLKGYLTLRVPNSLVKHNLEETADQLVEFMNVNVDRKWRHAW